MFRIDYGDESKLEINTTKKYNVGQWIKIEAAREFSAKRSTENGMLRVNNDRPISGAPTLPVNIHLLPDLSKAVYYLGGVPPGNSLNLILIEYAKLVTHCYNRFHIGHLQSSRSRQSLPGLHEGCPGEWRDLRSSGEFQHLWRGALMQGDDH